MAQGSYPEKIKISQTGTDSNVSATILNPSLSVYGTMSAIQLGNWNLSAAITNPSITVTALNLDIHDLSNLTDSVAASQSGAFTVRIQDTANNSLTSTGNALDINVKSSATTLSIDNAPGQSVAVDDNSGSLTVDGSVTVTGTVSIAGSVIVAQATASNLNTLIGNTSGASAVNVQDGGNSLTIDGTASVSQSGNWNISTTVTNPTIATIQSGNWNISATVTNPTIATIQSGNWNITVTATALDIRKLTAANDAVVVSQSGTWNIASITSVLIPGTGATHLGKAEDGAHTSGDTGIMALAVQKAVPTGLAGTDGDYQPLVNDSLSRLFVAPSRILSGAVTFINNYALNATTFITGSVVQTFLYRTGRLYYTITSSNTPTDVSLIVQHSPDNTIFYNSQEYWYGDLRYEDTATTPSINHTLPLFEPIGQFMRVNASATGTNNTNTFTVTVKGEYY